MSRGCTPLELLVVVAVIGLLAACVGPKYFNQIGKGEHSVAKAQIDSFARVVNNFRLDVRAFPTTDARLGALTARPASAAKWHGPSLVGPANPHQPA